jgi:excisionase family DNA binding protein
MKKQSSLSTKEPQVLESMLTIPQVAEILAVSHATVFRLIKYSGLPKTKMGHTTRIPEGKLHTWIEEHTA